MRVRISKRLFLSLYLVSCRLCGEGVLCMSINKEPPLQEPFPLPSARECSGACNAPLQDPPSFPSRALLVDLAPVTHFVSELNTGKRC